VQRSAVRVPAPAVPDVPAPLIAVASDGNVTLRVEQQPLEWVLEQIAHQSGWSDVRERAGLASGQIAAGAPAGPAPRPAPARVAASTPGQCPDSAEREVDAVRVVQSIETGTEAERFQGLMVARSAGIAVAEPTLKHLFQAGGSERVQVAAFEAWLALRSDQPDALRAALEEAQHAPSEPIQREARQRLAELRELQRLDALPPLTDP
jgi:hypothetical protein